MYIEVIHVGGKQWALVAKLNIQIQYSIHSIGMQNMYIFS